MFPHRLVMNLHQMLQSVPETLCPQALHLPRKHKLHTLHTSCIKCTTVQSSWYNIKVPLFYGGDFSGQKWIPNNGTASRDIENNNTVCISHIYIYICLYKYNIQSIPDVRDKRVWKTLEDLKFSWWGVHLLLSTFNPEDECSILLWNTGVTTLDCVTTQMTIIHIPHITVPNKWYVH